jgi:hypothetical protein
LFLSTLPKIAGRSAGTLASGAQGGGAGALYSDTIGVWVEAEWDSGWVSSLLKYIYTNKFIKNWEKY